MDLNPTTLDAIQTEWRALMADALKLVDLSHNDWFADLPMTSLATKFMMLFRHSRVRKWIGERGKGNFQKFFETIVIEEWEDSIPVEKAHIIYDQLGQYAQQLAELGEDKEVHKRELRDDMLVNGNGSDDLYLAYDGVPLFSDSHPIDKKYKSTQKQANRFTGTALTYANVDTIVTAMKALMAPNGNRMAINPNVLWYTTDLAADASEIIDQQKVGPAYLKTNKFFGKFKAVEIGHPTATGLWGLADLRGGASKPLVYAHGNETDPRWLGDPPGEKVKEGLFGFDMDDTVRPLWWPMVCQVAV